MSDHRADEAVVRSTQVLLDLVRRQSLPYADPMWSPISPLSVGLIAVRFGASLQEAPLPDGIQELGIPAYLSNPIVVVNRSLPPAGRNLALRHGLAHLVAGELERGIGSEVRFMSLMHDYMTLEERRADLFALADLIPDRDLPADAVMLAADVARYAPEWPLARLWDRVRLRRTLAASRD